MKQIQTMRLLDKMEQLDSSNVKLYLLSRGWKSVESKMPEMAIFHKGEGEDTWEILLPLDKTLLDYQRSMLHVVEAIAADEKQDISLILADLSFANADIIRFHWTGNNVGFDTISFLEGLKYLENIKKMLLELAGDELEEAEKFLNSCQMACSTNDGFLVSVICPLEKIEESSEMSIARKITTNLAQAVEQLENSLQLLGGKDVDELEEKVDAEEEKIIEDSLLSSLLQLKPSDSKGNLSLSVSWSYIEENVLPVYSAVLEEAFFAKLEDLTSLENEQGEESNGSLEETNGDLEESKEEA